MLTVNYNSTGEGAASVRYSLGHIGIPSARGDEDDVARVAHLGLAAEDARFLQTAAAAIGVTDRFRDVIATFKTPAGETPAGFRVEVLVDGGPAPAD